MTIVTRATGGQVVNRGRLKIVEVLLLLLLLMVMLVD